MTDRPQLAPLARRVAPLAGVLLVCLAAAELGLRLVHRLRPSFVFSSDAALRFRGRPHAPNYDTRLNSGGFNDREPAPRPAPGVFRIAALGDSMVFGVVPYRHNFLTLLEERLVHEGRPVEILNLGIPGTGPEHHPGLLLREVLALEPDAVLQFVYVGNDFTEELPTSPGRASLFTVGLLRFLSRQLPRMELRVYHPGPHYRDERPTFEEDTYLELANRHAAVFDPAWPEFALRRERLVAAVRRTAALCRSRGVELAVVLQPAELQVDAELRGRLSALRPGRELDPERPNRELARALAEAGVPFLDLLPELIAAGAEPLYKPRDSHWNLAGNRLAAERLYRWLTAGRAGFELPPPSSGAAG